MDTHFIINSKYMNIYDAWFKKNKNQDKGIG